MTGFVSLAAKLAGKCQPSERCDRVHHCEEGDRAELHKEEELFCIPSRQIVIAFSFSSQHFVLNRMIL